MQSESVSVAQVRKYLHLVDLNREDFDQELELQNLKGQITKMIRANQALEKDLDTMDIKIGLLVSNQIDVQEVLAHDRSLLKKMRKVSSRYGMHNAIFTGFPRKKPVVKLYSLMFLLLGPTNGTLVSRVGERE